MHYYFMTFLSVSFLMNYSIRLVPPVTWRLGVRHYIVTLFAALITSDDAVLAIYSLVHPQYPIAQFYVPRGFASDWLYFSSKVAQMILGLVIWIESGAAAARKPRGRSAFLRLWPLYTVVVCFNYSIFVQSHGFVRGNGGFFSFYVVGTAIIVLISFLVYLHFRSSSSDDLFRSQKAA
jgi:hypothetical protein